MVDFIRPMISFLIIFILQLQASVSCAHNLFILRKLYQCERTFSKMKLIKTTTRNTMSDDRLSDLCVLAVERDFVIDFEKLIDDFTDLRKNSRILLK